MSDIEQYKVKLINSRNRSEQVHFDVTPEVNETIQINYETIDPLHAPGQVFAYKNTSSRTFNVTSIRFISRTVEEAELNLRRLWLLRSWSRPTFGRSTLSEQQRENRELARNLDSLQFAQQGSDSNDNRDISLINRGIELLGRPPAVVLLSAYSRAGSLGNTTEHINRVPCVIDQFTIPYPSDVDYIHTPEGVPMPMIMSLDITLRETHSPQEYSNFSIFSYKNGTLRNF